jgi:hypothetical protein
MSRIVSWFSHGAASAVATKLVLAQHAGDDVHIVVTDTNSEHPDNVRFRVDCERWFGHPVEILKSQKYVDTWDVWERRKFLNSPHGAPCTGELKKKLRYAYQQPDDIQVFGYTAEEQDRADQFRRDNFDVNLHTPLIERGLTKSDCLAIVADAGIKLPTMYLLGYRNNNCIPCVKGGMGYWNKIRRDFPDAFDRMAGLEQRFGHALLREGRGTEARPLPLLELDPNRGDHADEPDMDCSLLCSFATTEIEAAA